VRADGEVWGRFVESGVGAHLVTATQGTSLEVRFWAAGSQELDIVLVKDERRVAVEIKSGPRRGRLPKVAAFCRKFPVERTLLVGGGGIPLEEFLVTAPGEWF